MRLFFAVNIPDELVRLISETQASVRARVPCPEIRWTKPEQFHYTLKFLGETPPERAHKALEAAGAACETHRPFPLTLGGVGAFPNDTRPSILWLGALDGGEQLTELARTLDAALVRAGFRRENREPKAHLTLARIKTYDGEKAVARALPMLRVAEVGSMLVDSVTLMQSNLRPTGAEYTVVEQLRLAAADER